MCNHLDKKVVGTRLWKMNDKQWVFCDNNVRNVVNFVNEKKEYPRSNEIMNGNYTVSVFTSIVE